jgi:hypothetical protein
LGERLFGIARGAYELGRRVKFTYRNNKGVTKMANKRTYNVSTTDGESLETFNRDELIYRLGWAAYLSLYVTGSYLRNRSPAEYVADIIGSDNFTDDEYRDELESAKACDATDRAVLYETFDAYNRFLISEGYEALPEIYR